MMDEKPCIPTGATSIFLTLRSLDRNANRTYFVLRSLQQVAVEQQQSTANMFLSIVATISTFASLLVFALAPVLLVFAVIISAIVIGVTWMWWTKVQDRTTFLLEDGALLGIFLDRSMRGAEELALARRLKVEEELGETLGTTQIETRDALAALLNLERELAGKTKLKLALAPLGYVGDAGVQRFHKDIEWAQSELEASNRTTR